MSVTKKYSVWILVGQVLKHLWHRIWHCRVAVISVALGGIALSLPVVQDLFLEPMSWWTSVLFAVTVLFFWTIPVHRAARAGVESMEQDPAGVLNAGLDPALIARIKAGRSFIDVWLPRLLGFLTLAMLLDTATDARDGAVTMAGLVSQYDKTVLQLTIVIAVLLCALAGYVVYLLFRGQVRRRGPADSDAMREEPWYTLGIVHTAVSLIYFSWAVLAPLGFTGIIGRVSLLPVLLGAPLPILSPVAVLGNRWRTPLILFGLLVMVAISAGNAAFHDVRRFTPPDTAGLTRAATLDQAIDAWMAANNCAGNAAACPEAVLVAASGGGSRAAFFTATVVGQVLDDISAGPAGPAAPGRQLFALSGVSGGAVGSAIIRAALQDAGASGAPPCRFRSRLWFAATDSPGAWPQDEANPETWRQCLQDLAAGDLLSAPIAGLAYRDYLAPPIPLPDSWGFGDRNVLIEQALEQHYNYVMHDDPNACSDKRTDGLCRPLGYRIKDGQAVGGWVPLLLLSTTSVDHGSLILASDFDVAGWCLPNSADLFHLLQSTTLQPEPVAQPRTRNRLAPEAPPCRQDFNRQAGAETTGDLRLSTASLLSGRFPAVLTAANLRNRSGDVAERVVDGGYFDNSGAAALKPVLSRLAERNIRTVTLLLDNEPADVKTREDVRKTQQAQPSDQPVEPVDVSFLQRASALLFEPLLTLERTRAVRATEALAAYEAEVDRIAAQRTGGESPRATLLRFTVMRSLDNAWCTSSAATLSLHDLVVSWWLSPIGQLFVEKQLCAPENARALIALRGALGLPATADAAQ